MAGASPNEYRAESPGRSTSEFAMFTLGLLVAVGVGTILIYSLQHKPAEFARLAATGLAVGGAALMIGGILGFLFGIPRTLQQEGHDRGPVPSGGQAAGQQEAGGLRGQYGINTNLEQISDWLTKILVGVGLTQLTELPDAFRRLAAAVGRGLGNPATADIFALGLMLYFLICGFLYAYLWARLYLKQALIRAELEHMEALTNRMEQAQEDVQRKLDEIKRRAEADARALSLVERMLDPELPPVSQQELNAAIAAASPAIRVQCFYATRGRRQDAARQTGLKTVLQRTVPVFRALIRSDRGGEFHRNHAQLAYALKDQPQPEWQEALDHFNEAIRIRGPEQAESWPLYEFNRAICRIHLDENFRNRQASDEQTQGAVRSDLQVVVRQGLDRLLEEEPVVSEWLKLNGGLEP